MMGDIAVDAVWIRYFASGHTTQVDRALDSWPASVRQAYCRSAEELGRELDDAAHARIVVIDSHGWPDHAGIGTRTGKGQPDLPLTQLEDVVLDQCELLIVGACYQGRHLGAWEHLAPHAVIVAATRTVKDLGGCEVIAELVCSAQQGEEVSAEWAIRVTGGRYGFTAAEPAASRLEVSS